jgi:hypothetical protein
LADQVAQTRDVREPLKNSNEKYGLKLTALVVTTVLLLAFHTVILSTIQKHTINGKDISVGCANVSIDPEKLTLLVYGLKGERPSYYGLVSTPLSKQRLDSSLFIQKSTGGKITLIESGPIKLPKNDEAYNNHAVNSFNKRQSFAGFPVIALKSSHEEDQVNIHFLDLGMVMILSTKHKIDESAFSFTKKLTC